jgi:anti-sigma factor RsiW
MKSHSYIQSRLLLMLDQELSPRQQKLMQQHLQQCQECQALLVQMRKVYLDKRDTVPPMSPFVWTRLQARMQNRSSQKRFFAFAVPLFKPAIVVVMLLLSLLTGRYLGSYEPQTVAAVSDEELVYRTFGMDATEPFAGHTLAGAVHAVYDQP